MTSRDQFEAWATEHLPTLYLTKTDQGTYESAATGNFFAVWSARDGEIERLQRERTDWQAACLKRGFTYCREPDDHYVLADVPEMAALLGEVLGVEVRDRENDSYGETVSDLKDQVDAGIDAFHRAYQAETERDKLKATVSDYEMGLEAAKEEIARLKGENEWLRRQIESIAGQHAPLEPIPDEDGWSRKLPGYDLVSLLRDAERYRWLRMPWQEQRRVKVWTSLEVMDENIDAAMSKEASDE